MDYGNAVSMYTQTANYRESVTGNATLITKEGINKLIAGETFERSWTVAMF